jgi:hypothetical protein
MGTAIAVRRDYSSRELRRLATRVKDAAQARRLLAHRRWAGWELAPPHVEHGRPPPTLVPACHGVAGKSLGQTLIVLNRGRGRQLNWKTMLGSDWDKTYAASNTIYVAHQNNIISSGCSFTVM